jgi:hypothetical protein
MVKLLSASQEMGISVVKLRHSRQVGQPKCDGASLCKQASNDSKSGTKKLIFTNSFRVIATVVVGAKNRGLDLGCLGPNTSFNL